MGAPARTARRGLADHRDAEKPAWLRPHGAPWRPAARAAVFENPLDHGDRPDGRSRRPASRRPMGWCGSRTWRSAVLPIHDDGTVTLVGQHRFPLRRLQLGAARGRRAAGRGPAGRAPSGSWPRRPAWRRAEWREVMRTQLSNSVTDERMVGYLATGLSPAAPPQPPTTTEAIALVAGPVPRGAGRGDGRASSRHADSGDAAAGLPYGR